MGSRYQDVLALKKKFQDAYEKEPERFHRIYGRQGTWTPKMLVALFELINEPDQVPQEEMANMIGVDRSTITRKINKMDWGRFETELRALCGGSSHALALEADDYKKDLMAKQAIRERRSLVEARSEASRIEDAIARLVPTLEKSKFPPLYFGKKTAKDRTPEDMVLLLSDFHVGYEFTLDETGGLSEYNYDIFRRRMDNLRKAVLEILQLHGETRPIRTLHVFGLGDFVHGSQLGGQWGPAYTIEDVTEQSWKAAKTTSEIIETWANYFERVEFLGVIGNHGRAGAYENSDKISANWDRNSYLLLSCMLKDRKNVLVECPRAWWRQKIVQGKAFLLLHGDNMKGGIESLLKEGYKLQDLIRGVTPAPYDYLCLGHYHSCRTIETSTGAILINGSTLKGDMYSYNKLRVKSTPSQMLMGVHPEHGVTWKYELNLDADRK
jgi:predicted phosphodiesterase